MIHYSTESLTDVNNIVLVTLESGRDASDKVGAV